MQVHITARHLDLTDPIADYIQKKMSRIGKHFSSVIRAHVIITVEKQRHIAEVIVHANGHHDFRAQGESLDLYAAVDLVVEKTHKHFARQKDKRVTSRRRNKSVPFGPEDAALLGRAAEPVENLAPPITRVTRFSLEEMTVTEAVEEMERQNNSFFIFLNDGAVNVIYKRSDKTYGLLEPDV